MAFQLGLDRKAHLDDTDLKSIIDFSPRYSISPPKALADLFEAYVGGVYEEYGWNITKDWLEILLKPLVEQATEDYIERPETSLIRGVYVSHKLLHKVEHHQKLFDYIEPRAEDFEIMAGPALFPLSQGLKFVIGPRGDIGNDRNMVDIATHLVKFWICQAFMSEYPENRKAYTKAPHLISVCLLLILHSDTDVYSRVSQYLSQALGHWDFSLWPSDLKHSLTLRIPITLSLSNDSSRHDPYLHVKKTRSNVFGAN